MFGDVANCIYHVADEHVAFVGTAFLDLANHRRRCLRTLLNGITADGRSIPLYVSAELVAYSDSDAWIAIHGWRLQAADRQGQRW